MLKKREKDAKQIKEYQDDNSYYSRMKMRNQERNIIMDDHKS